MTNRRAFIRTTSATLLVAASGARAQPTSAPRRMGYLSSGYAATQRLRGVLVDELRTLGWIEGRTLAIESR